MRTAVAAAIVTAMSLLTVGSPAGASGSPAPVYTEHSRAFGYSLTHPGAAPRGANDWDCRPTRTHPRPVVLVHGTLQNRFAAWSRMAPALTRSGYCVFALNYGTPDGTALRGASNLVDHAVALENFVQRVQRATGARRVDLVGHGQGATMPRYYLRDLVGHHDVHRLIGLAPTNYGTTGNGLLRLLTSLPAGPSVVGLACTACAQQAADSYFLNALNRGPDTVGKVRYATIVTSADHVVTPYTNGFLKGDRVRNRVLQRVCRQDQADHFEITYDPTAIAMVKQALDPRHSERVRC